MNLFNRMTLSQFEQDLFGGYTLLDGILSVKLRYQTGEGVGVTAMKRVATHAICTEANIFVCVSLFIIRVHTEVQPLTNPFCMPLTQPKT